MPSITKEKAQKRRHTRVRKKISGTMARPRLSVFRSNAHIYAQLIDDDAGATLVSACSQDKEIKNMAVSADKAGIAGAVGKLIGQRAKEKGIDSVVFDRGGFLYHGRIKALADGAREAGLEF